MRRFGSAHALSVVVPQRVLTFCSKSPLLSSFDQQDVDPRRLNHSYWNNDVLAPYLDNLLIEEESSGESNSQWVSNRDLSLLNSEYLKWFKGPRR
mmetsp:Transcript_44079/g.50957  ORF Transcript_44079/g.50957 Transcript_44079/m.50957 type:complete len:95 (-) Transcript_44079:266-550(-)